MKNTRTRTPARKNEAVAGSDLRGFFRKLAACGTLVAALGGAGTSTAGAAVNTWIGGTTNWGTAANWNGGLPASTTDQAIFGSPGSTGLADLGEADRTVGGFTFNSTVDTTITSDGAGQTLTSDAAIDCFVNVLGGSHVINANFTAPADLRLKGTGNLTFGKNVTAAVLAIGSMENASNPSYNGTVTFSGNVETNGAYYGDITLAGASALTLVIGGNLTNTLGYTILASGITVRAAAGSHRIDDTYGGTYISNVTFDGPGDLTISNAYIDNLEGTLPTQMTYRMNGTGKVIFEGLDGFQTGMGLIKTGSGTMEIQNTALYTGNTHVSAGTLLATNPGALRGYLTGQVSVASGATLAVRAGGGGEQWLDSDLAGLLATGSFASGSALGIEVNTGDSFTYANNLGVTQAAKGLVKSGAGTVTLTDANTFSGNTRVTAGTLALDHVNALQNSTLDLTGAGSVTFTVAGSQTYQLGGVKGSALLNAGANSLKVGANGESTVSTGGITAAALTKEGAGTLILTGPQTYATLTTGAGAGETIINTAIGSGTTAVVANASIRFGTVSQKFASLTIGAGAAVTFTSGTATGSFSGGGLDGKAAGSAVVPEPGTFGLLLAGSLGWLARRQRPARK